jgi:integrative and conjugative element protein (TIGR02256 family)
VINGAVEAAVAQLTELEKRSGGALQVLVRPDDHDRANTVVVSIETGIAAGRVAGGGIRVRARERFEIVVPDAFPFEPPMVWTEHRRWAGTRHVQWERYLCLYAAPSVEWVPADGMRGLINRLLVWLERGAAGTLDPDGQPLHPPATYPSAPGCVVVHPNVGNRIPSATSGDAGVLVQFAWCVRDHDRVDVLYWLSESQVVDRANKKGATPVNTQGQPYFIALVVIFADEIAWEYPNRAGDLAARLADMGYASTKLLDDLVWTNKVNRFLQSQDPSARPDEDPVIMLLGTPSRRVAGDEKLIHLVAWKLDPLGVKITALLGADPESLARKDFERLRGHARRWLDDADVQWLRVYEQRSEITRRRDGGTATSWVQGKRVLILGCGALGAPTAEHCVRAGAKAVTVLDCGIVTPGILVRQPYTYDEIGRAKATVLADRLNTIARKNTVNSIVDNAITHLRDGFDPSTYDLVLDATASSGVRAALEHVHRIQVTSGASWPPTATMIIGHRADIGLAAVSQSGATGTGHDILRRAVLHARRTADPDWQDIVADFFPDPPRTDTFFPEPGCSEPTFVGSATDVAALAASMLNAALHQVAAEESGSAAMIATAIRQPHAAQERLRAAEILTWPNDTVLTDPTTGYDVRISANAMSEIRTEARRGNRTRGPAIETGGMLLGSIDEATGIINIDLATGPSPDSTLSSQYFHHGTDGTQAVIDDYVRRTNGVTDFLGIWHTHPGGPTAPSQMDEDGMRRVTLTNSTYKALMLIVGGSPATWRNWIEADGRPDFYVRLVERNPAATPAATGSLRPDGPHFPGGFAPPASARPPRCRRWFCWWMR